MDLYTIGHSNHTSEKFTQLLANHAVKCLVDVRSTPYSRYNPQFNQAALRQTLEELGIMYVYLGKELGGRPSDPSCYTNHTLPVRTDDFPNEIIYSAVMERPWFRQGIQSLLELAKEQATCIMCSEKDPQNCHRHHLIASYLIDHHPEVRIWHILADGRAVEAKDLPSVPGKAGTGQLSF